MMKKWLIRIYSVLPELIRHVRTSLLSMLPVAFWCLRLLRPEISAQIVAGLIAIVRPKTRAHADTIEQLNIVFPDRPAHELELLARENHRNLGFALGELPHLQRLQTKPRYVRWLDHWGLPKAPELPAQCVYVTLPLVNTWLSLCLSRSINPKLAFIYNPNDAVSKPLLFMKAFLNGHTRAIASTSGQAAISTALADGFSPLCRLHLNAKSGVVVPFGDSQVTIDPQPALLAWRLGAPIKIPVISRLGPACFSLTAIETLPTLPKTAIDQSDWVFDTCTRLAAHLLEHVRRQPNAWLCEGKIAKLDRQQEPDWSGPIRV